ncbi:MAG: serine hydrolase, partial [Cyclobacteriaceae bacterium]
LQAKFSQGLNRRPRLNGDNLALRLNRPEAEVITRKIREESVTILNNSDNAVPVKQLDNRSFAMVNFGNAGKFPDYLNRYTAFTQIESSLPTDQLIKKLSGYNVVVAGIFPNQSDEAIAEITNVLAKVQGQSRVITCYFGNPYRIAELQRLNNVVTQYSDTEDSHLAMAEVIFGAIPANGKLPVTVSRKWKEGTGAAAPSLRRLGYGIPEAQGMDGRTLSKIDELAREAVEIGATPGCQVLVAKDGKVVYMKNFGYQTYDSIRPVDDQTIYDLASVTKVLASTQAIMFLQERGLIDMDKKLSVYLPELKGTNKENMILRDILTHQAGLWVYLPFYAQTLDGREFMPEYYHPKPTPVYTMKVADGLYAKPLVKDSLYQWVINSRVRKKQLRVPYEYKYSDMGYYLMQRMIENMINQSISDFMQYNFYEPMGMTSTGYRPLDRFPRERIAPTEQDNFFRKTLVDGMVHDQGAALMGGIAGHAGLFGTANDLAKNLQMLLQGGQYGGTRFFQRETIVKFTEQQYANNRRGMGWDKPLNGEWFGPTSEYASKQTFGHTGFTGTAIWADPEFDLIYVFLANRIYPDAGNSKLLKENIRTRIQNVIYESIFDYRSTHEVN